MTQTKTRDRQALADLFPAPKRSPVANQVISLRRINKNLNRADEALRQWRAEGSSWEGYSDYHDLPNAKAERFQARLRDQIATAKKVLNLHGKRDQEGAKELLRIINELEAQHQWTRLVPGGSEMGE